MKLISPHFEAYAGQKEEHALLTSAFAEVGIEYLPWDAGHGEVPQGDAIFWQGISSYHQRMDRFEELLKDTEKRGMVLLNSTNILRWNADKRYLRDLEEKGVLCLDTLWLENYDSGIISAWAKEKTYHELVVKPVVSAGAHHTYRVMVENLTTLEYPENTPLMVQPFAPEILEGGEYSYLFFGGEFSHAVRKTPKAGDYRIQHVHGGKYERIIPSSEQLQQAIKILESLPEKPFYARVDGIWRNRHCERPTGEKQSRKEWIASSFLTPRNDEFILMEVELIEPYFYLDAAPEQVKFLAQQLKALSPWGRGLGEGSKLQASK